MPTITMREVTEIVRRDWNLERPILSRHGGALPGMPAIQAGRLDADPPDFVRG